MEQENARATAEDVRWLELRLSRAGAIASIGAETESEGESAADRFYGTLDRESGEAEAARIRRILNSLRALAKDGSGRCCSECGEDWSDHRCPVSRSPSVAPDREALARTIGEHILWAVPGETIAGELASATRAAADALLALFPVPQSGAVPMPSREALARALYIVFGRAPADREAREREWPRRSMARAHWSGEADALLRVLGGFPALEMEPYAWEVRNNRTDSGRGAHLVYHPDEAEFYRRERPEYTVTPLFTAYESIPA